LIVGFLDGACLFHSLQPNGAWAIASLLGVFFFIEKVQHTQLLSWFILPLPRKSDVLARLTTKSLFVLVYYELLHLSFGTRALKGFQKPNVYP
jgi:hypothetical protein